MVLALVLKSRRCLSEFLCLFCRRQSPLLWLCDRYVARDCAYLPSWMGMPASPILSWSVTLKNHDVPFCPICNLCPKLLRVLQRPSLHVEVATKFQHALPSIAGSVWPLIKSSALWVVLVSATHCPFLYIFWQNQAIGARPGQLFVPKVRLRRFGVKGT